MAGISGVGGGSSFWGLPYAGGPGKADAAGRVPGSRRPGEEDGRMPGSRPGEAAGRVPGDLFGGNGRIPERFGRPGEADSEDPDKKPGRKSSPEDCETCKNRKYQDGSDEADVSFKAAAHISPEASASTVRAHESEHVANAYEKAAQKGGKVISAGVSIHTAVCPECGRVYVSGGETRTRIAYPADPEKEKELEEARENNPYEKERDAIKKIVNDGINFKTSV